MFTLYQAQWLLSPSFGFIVATVEFHFHHHNRHRHHHHHHNLANMELGPVLTRSGLTCLEFHCCDVIVCLRAGPLSLPKWVIHGMRYSASLFKFRYPLSTLLSSSSCLSPLPHLPVPSSFTSITCFWWQFLRKLWPSHLDFFRCIVCSMFLSSLILCDTSWYSTYFVWFISPILFRHHILKLSRYFWSTIRSVKFQHHTKPCPKRNIPLVSSLNLSQICWCKESSSRGMLLLPWQLWL